MESPMEGRGVFVGAVLRFAGKNPRLYPFFGANLGLHPSFSGDSLCLTLLSKFAFSGFLSKSYSSQRITESDVCFPEKR